MCTPGRRVSSTSRRRPSTRWSTGRSCPATWIAGAGLDDIEEEPAKQRDWVPGNPLFTLPNAILTPHAAYYSQEAIHTVRDFAAHEVVRVLTGQHPLSPVNADQLARLTGQAERPAVPRSGPRTGPGE